VKDRRRRWLLELAEARRGEAREETQQETALGLVHWMRLRCSLARSGPSACGAHQTVVDFWLARGMPNELLRRIDGNIDYIMLSS
jgi:hypothetical protein